MIELAYKYIDDVMSGKVLVNDNIRLAVERHLNDIDNAKDKGIYFDEKSAKQYLKCSQFFRHTGGAAAKKRFNIQPFQAFALMNLYGWKKDDDQFRFTRFYLDKARKNGKTEFVALIASLRFCFLEMYQHQIYSAATKKDQAKITFNSAKIMLKQLIEESQHFKKKLEILKYRISIPDTESWFEYVASDADSLDGLMPGTVIIDEYHAHKTSDVLKVMETGMASTLNRLMMVTTTAGFNIAGPCYKYRKNCIDILNGRKHDEAIFPLIYTLDDDDDWEDEAMWGKANPNDGVSITPNFLSDMYNQALNEGTSAIIEFKTKHLNTWVRSEDMWIDDKIWMEAGTDWSPDDMIGRECFAGLDLASTKDLTSLALFFPGIPGDERHKLEVFHFVPMETAVKRSKNDFADYIEWAEDGWMNLTGKVVTDYGVVEQEVMRLMELYNIMMIGYDRYNSSHLVTRLIDMGAYMQPFNQSIYKISEPTKEFERMANMKMIDHRNNPVMRWQLTNVMIKRLGDYMKVDKEKAADKVDGVVASVMAIGEWMTYYGLMGGDFEIKTIG